MPKPFVKYKLPLLLVFFSFLFVVSGKAQKIDTIYHINGNVLTGDFKKMVYGVVTWKMDGMGTINLEVTKINTIKSPKQFEVKLKNGLVYYGSFDTSGIARHVYIVLANGRELVSVNEMVEVYPIKRNFWKRTSGDFSLGVNYSKGSNLATVNTSGDLNYRKRKSYFQFSWDDYNTFQSDTLSSTKADGSFAWQRLLKKKWYISTMLGFSQNSELGTKLRVNLSFLALHDFVYNSWNRFYLGGGISGQRETPYDTTGITNDLVGIFAVVWKVYKLTSPKVWVDANVTFIPYMTGKSRDRLNINLFPQISVVDNNLKIGIKTYYSLDTRPQSINAAKSDWGVSLTLTYHFH